MTMHILIDYKYMTFAYAGSYFWKEITCPMIVLINCESNSCVYLIII